jgi:ABC-type molybdate transport system substrate-binding protein
MNRHAPENAFKIRLALVLIGALALALLAGPACSRCSSTSSRSADGPLLLVAPASLLSKIGPLLTAYTKTHPEERVTLIAAEGDAALAQAEQADLFVISGRMQAEALARRVKLQDEPRIYMNEKVELLALSSFEPTVTRPSHLLQPALRKIAVVTDERAAGRAARESLDDWRLTERLKLKLVTAKDSADALRMLESGGVDAAFVLSGDHSGRKGLKILLGASQRPSSVLPLYIAQVRDNPKQMRVQPLWSFLTSAGVRDHLSKSGYLLPEQNPVPKPTRQPISPRIHPSRVPKNTETE